MPERLSVPNRPAAEGGQAVTLLGRYASIFRFAPRGLTDAMSREGHIITQAFNSIASLRAEPELTQEALGFVVVVAGVSEARYKIGEDVTMDVPRIIADLDKGDHPCIYLGFEPLGPDNPKTQQLLDSGYKAIVEYDVDSYTTMINAGRAVTHLAAGALV